MACCFSSTVGGWNWTWKRKCQKHVRFYSYGLCLSLKECWCVPGRRKGCRARLYSSATKTGRLNWPELVSNLPKLLLLSSALINRGLQPLSSYSSHKTKKGCFLITGRFHTGMGVFNYIYAFSRRFYPKRLTLHSSYSFTFYQLLLSLGIEPMILALLAPCSTI